MKGLLRIYQTKNTFKSFTLAIFSHSKIFSRQDFEIYFHIKIEIYRIVNCI